MDGLKRLLFLRAMGCEYYSNNLSFTKSCKDLDELNKMIFSCKLCNASGHKHTYKSPKDVIFLEKSSFNHAKKYDQASNLAKALGIKSFELDFLQKCEKCANEDALLWCKPYFLEKINLIPPLLIICLGFETSLHLGIKEPILWELYRYKQSFLLQGPKLATCMSTSNIKQFINKLNFLGVPLA